MGWPKGDAGNPVIDTKKKPASVNFCASNGPTSFATKVDPLGPSDAKKLAAALLLCVFYIGFQESL